MIEPDFKMNRKPFSAYDQDELRALMMRDARGNKPPPQHREYAGPAPAPRRTRKQMQQSANVAVAYTASRKYCRAAEFAAFSGLSLKVARRTLNDLAEAGRLQRVIVQDVYVYASPDCPIQRSATMPKLPWEART